jgi:hypothetical protein
MKQLLFRDLREGMRVLYKRFSDTTGIIHKEGDNWYFLSNTPEYDGSKAKDMKSFKYSYWFGAKELDDSTVFHMEIIGNSLGTTFDDDIKGDSVPRNKQIDTLLILGL